MQETKKINQSVHQTKQNWKTKLGHNKKEISSYAQSPSHLTETDAMVPLAVPP